MACLHRAAYLPALEGRSSPPSGDCHLRNRLARLAKDDSGAAAVEYGLLTALVALGIIASLTSVNSGLRTIFSQMSATLAAH